MGDTVETMEDIIRFNLFCIVANDLFESGVLAKLNSEAPAGPSMVYHWYLARSKELYGEDASVYGQDALRDDTHELRAKSRPPQGKHLYYGFLDSQMVDTHRYGKQVQT